MSLIHSFLDSNVTGRIERPDGVVYRRGDDTIIIGTSNRSPGDLPETVSDRFELSLRVTSYSPDALETIVDPGLRELARRDARRASAELPPAAPAPPTLRAVQAADRLARRLGDRELALWLVFGSEAPEIESLLSSILTDVSSE
jgi:MoxR-like ATPase